MGLGAKGNYREGSDIDLTLKGNMLSEKFKNDIYWQIEELNLLYFVDLSLYGELNSENLKNHIDIVGKILYEKLV